MQIARGHLFPGVVVLAAALTGCGKGDQGFTMPTPEVGVVVAHSEPVQIQRDLVGRLSPTRASDVRARVPGVLLKRLYKEGTDVREGQVLFQIDPAPLKAALQGAEAALVQAEASATNAHVLAQRYRGLVQTGAISKSDLDTAEANERSTAAQVQQAKASLETARINLGYATVRAPISGRAGQQQVTEGALVGQTEPTLLTTIEQIDPIYVNFDQPAAEVQRLRRAQAAGQITLAAGDKAQVQLTLPDGTPYGQVGTLDFLDLSVDPNTGAMAFRGVIPNPDRQLLPGMFVNVRVTVGQLNSGFLVPQVAVQTDANGTFVPVVNAEEKVEQRRVETAGTRADKWIVTSGLKDGDRIVVSGIQRAPVGAQVKIVPQEAPAEKAASANGGSASGQH
jgi:membrane fusion protein (multidrug efflux system)